MIEGLSLRGIPGLSMRRGHMTYPDPIAKKNDRWRAASIDLASEKIKAQKRAREEERGRKGRTELSGVIQT
jgi:hypothetical protein